MDALKVNRWLRTLDVAENDLTDDSALFLAEMLLSRYGGPLLAEMYSGMYVNVCIKR